MTQAKITSSRIDINQRIQHTADLFGLQFPLRIEPYIYSLAAGLSANYEGGYWHFYTLSNGGFYMAPDDEQVFNVVADNGFEGKLTADALGIAACLYAYSHLSFRDNPALAIPCAEQYHLLRDYMLEHAEVDKILGAID